MIIPQIKVTPKGAILLMIGCTLFTSMGQIFLKKGILKADFSFLFTLWNGYFFLGFFAYGLGALLMMLALKNGELSVLYPILATSYVWVSLLSPFFFQEKMNFWKWLGVMTILLSISLLGKNNIPSPLTEKNPPDQKQDPLNECPPQLERSA